MLSTDSDEEGVDVLVNNAGLMRCPKWKTEDGFEMQFGVNHLGNNFCFSKRRMTNTWGGGGGEESCSSVL